MIDVENIVFSGVKDALVSAHPALFENPEQISSEYVDVPAGFPCVTIVESDNAVYKRMSTLELETHASLTYDVNVYSNKASGKKSEAMSIAQTVDSAMKRMGFTRKLKNPMPNLQDARIYRLFLRYEGIVDDEHFVYQS